MRVLICDTGPLLCLHEADLLDLLHATGQLYIPPAVESELKTLDPIPEWVQVVALDDSFSAQARIWVQAGLLDPGEAEAIVLTQQLGADWMVTDDAAARLLANREGIEVHGSLGIVLWGAATGLLGLEAANEALNALSRTSLWISQRVLAEARAALSNLGSKT